MTKETLTLDKIALDLKRVASQNWLSRSGAIQIPLFFIPLLAVGLGFITQNLLIGFLIFLTFPPTLLYYIRERRAHKASMREIEELVARNDVSISVETLSHIAKEMVYAPHSSGRHTHATRRVTFFYFMSGSSWRVPDLYHYSARRRQNRHYFWSETCSLSEEGLQNTSVQGDEFYHISLQSDHEISYIYPLKFFVLAAGLKVKDAPLSDTKSPT